MIPTQAHLEQLVPKVKAFNDKYKVGDKVNLQMGDGTIKSCTVKFAAEVLGGHSAVAWFNEISGCYSIDRVKEK